MFGQFEATAAVARRRAVGLTPLHKTTLFLALAIIVSGCASRDAIPLAGPDPADASAPTSRVGYRSTLGDYRSGRPVGPSPWIQQNQRVAPAPKQQ